MLAHYLSGVLLLPLLGLLGALLTPPARPARARAVALASATAAAVAAVPLWWLVNVGPGGESLQLLDTGFGALTSPLLGVDGFSALLVLLTTVMGCVAAWLTRVDDPGLRRRALALLALEAALLGACLAANAVLFLIGADLVLLAMFVLAPAGAARSHPARLFLGVAAAVAILDAGALLTLVVASGDGGAAHAFDAIRLRALTLPVGTQRVIFLAMGAAALLRVLLGPLWARLAAPGDRGFVAGAPLALVSMSIGMHALVRFALPVVPDAARSLAAPAAVACVGLMVAMAWMACATREWSRVAVCAAGGQCALALLGLMTLNPDGVTGGLLQVVLAGLSAGALIVVIRLLEIGPAPHGDDPVAMARPLLAAVLLVLTIAAAGTLLMAGPRDLWQGTLRRGTWWALAAGGSVVASLASLILPYRRVMLGRVGTRPFSPRQHEPALAAGEQAVIQPTGFPVLPVAVSLAALVLWVAINPAPLIARLTPTATRVVLRISPEFTAECDTSLTPEIVASTPGGQFLAAAPCGPDGVPLVAPSGPAAGAAPAGAAPAPVP